jgi:hypothetical protein
MKIYQLDDLIFKHIIEFMEVEDMNKVTTTITKFVCTQIPPLSLQSNGDTIKSFYTQRILHHYIDKIDILTSRVGSSYDVL